MKISFYWRNPNDTLGMGTLDEDPEHMYDAKYIGNLVVQVNQQVREQGINVKGAVVAVVPNIIKGNTIEAT